MKKVFQVIATILVIGVVMLVMAKWLFIFSDFAKIGMLGGLAAGFILGQSVNYLKDATMLFVIPALCILVCFVLALILNEHFECASFAFVSFTLSYSSTKWLFC